MSLKHMTWAWQRAEDLELKPGPTLVLVALADSCHHETGCCDWAPAALAGRARVSRSTLYRHLAELAEHGLFRQAQLRHMRSGRCSRIAFWVNPSGETWPACYAEKGLYLFENSGSATGVNVKSQIETPRSPTGETPQRPNCETPKRTQYGKTYSPVSESSDSETSPRQKPKPKRKRVELPADLVALRDLWPADRRHRMPPEKQLEAFEQALEDFGGFEPLFAAARRYTAKEGDYARTFGRALRDGDLEPYKPQVIPLDKWRKAIALHRETGWWGDPDLGPRPGEAGCRVPPQILLEAEFPAQPEEETRHVAV